MFCLSKGLGAPVGSLVCGRRDFVKGARRVRKMLGGGMRQVGVLAAAGLVALRQGPARLAADHEHAKLLAQAVAELPGVELDLASVRTNIVIFGLGAPAGPFLDRLKENGILAVPVGPERVRFVTHRDVSRAQVDKAVAAIQSLAAATRATRSISTSAFLGSAAT
jgi:threonine aldolase